MQKFKQVSRARLALAAVAILSMSLASAASAQEPLRWKFDKGAKFNYDTLQDMTIGSTGGPGGPQNVTMHQELKMTWAVQEVNQDGDAVIQQKIDSVKMKMALPPPVGAIEYDSAAEKPPAGPAAMLAPMYTAMMKGAFVITVSPRGEIKDVKIPEEVVAMVKNNASAAALSEIATPDGFKKMMQQTIIEFPEDAAQQQKEWTKPVEVVNAAGKQIVETTYKYIGTKDVEGVTHAQFQPTVKMSFEGAQVKISQQESDGEILFNVAEGRLGSSKLEQHVTLDQAGVQTKIDQEIAVTLKPAGAASGEKPAADTEAEAKK